MMKTVARAQGMSEIFDLTYHPQDYYEYEYFKAMQAFFYFILQTVVQYITGKAIIKYHQHDYDARQCLIELEADAKASTHAVIQTSKMLEAITTERLDARWTRPLLDFIKRFDNLIQTYNEQQERADSRISDQFAKLMLQNAVMQQQQLAMVATREFERIKDGHHPCTYAEYLALLESAASTYDANKAAKSGVGRRSAFNAFSLNGMDEEDDDEPIAAEDMAQEITEYVVNQMKRNRSLPGSKMNKETWDSLSEETKKLWDKFDDKEKRSILSYAYKRAMKRDTNQSEQGDTLEAHVTEQVEDKQDKDEDDPEENNKDVDRGMIEVHNAIARARGEAHPGDVRKMMGSKPKPSPPTRKAMNVTFYPDSDSEDDMENLLQDCDEIDTDTEEGAAFEPWGGHDSGSDEDF
jgi:hypothetical protein